jgi:hypothetical protein
MLTIVPVPSGAGAIACENAGQRGEKTIAPIEESIAIKSRIFFSGFGIGEGNIIYQYLEFYQIFGMSIVKYK